MRSGSGTRPSRWPTNSAGSAWTPPGSNLQEETGMLTKDLAAFLGDLERHNEKT